MTNSGQLASPVIAGAGLAGTLMTILFARRGLDVQVYERNPDLRRVSAPAGRSINLALAERGIHALKKAGVYSRIEDLLIPMRGRMLHTSDGQLALQPYSRNPQEMIYSVSRAELTAVLLDEAERSGKVRISFSHQVRDFSVVGGITCTEHLANEGETANRSAEPAMIQIENRPLIAADGAGSVIRRCLQRQKIIDADESLLSHKYKELRIPPADDGGYRIEPEALHIWPRGGFMLIALPNPDASFTVTLFMAENGNPGLRQLTTTKAVKDFFAKEFPDTLSLIPDLESAFLENPTGVLGTVRCDPWHVGGQALLFGDAAHAIVPFHGQGMNCAFEDCAVMDELLAKGDGDWQTIFERFGTQRKPDTDAIATMALENYIEMRDTVRDPKFHLRKALAWELEAKYPERFVPRYSMVMFRRVPYSVALARGAHQAHMLESLTRDAQSLEDIDWPRAEQMIHNELPPLDQSLLVG